MPKHRILIVEDEGIAAISLESRLTALGYECAGIAFSGDEAMKQVEVSPPDLVLMDIKLQGSESGIEVASKIKAVHDVPIIFLTAYADDETLFKARETAPFGYLIKPTRDITLKTTIELALEKFQLEKKVAILAEFGEFALSNPSIEILQAKFKEVVIKAVDPKVYLFFKSTQSNDQLQLATEVGLEKKEFENSVIPLTQVLNVLGTEEIRFAFQGGSETKFVRDAFAISQGLQNEVWIRIGSDLELYGLLVLYTSAEHPLSKQDISFLKSMGVMLSNALYRERVEGKLRHAVEQSEAEKKKALIASQTKSEFLANMSHEIRTPLGIILGFSEILADSGESLSDADRLHYISIIKRNGKLLSAIINDILDLSKVEAGKLDMENIELSVPLLLKDISDQLELLANSKGILLNIVCDKAIPVRIVSDPTRLRQILLNIIGNAIKFTAVGAVDVKVRVDQKMGASNHLVFEVKDTGCGISGEDAQRLFSPFTQIDEATTRKFDGTGLGLVLARRLAQTLGGDVVLEQSTPGVGSTFRVWISVGEIESLAKEKPVHEQQRMNSPAITKPVPLDGLHILLVEDAKDNQLLISRILQGAGAVIDIAENGKEGIEKANLKPYDAILMDIQMPIMDGYEATKTLRRSGLEVPILALTARAMKEERDRCIAFGFSDHITKPIESKELVERILKNIQDRSSALSKLNPNQEANLR